MNVVSIMAHQDDEMRCLGTMLKCRERGDSLDFIVLTDGSSGRVTGREEVAAVRTSEMTALAEDLGARLIELGEYDEYLYDTPALRKRLIGTMREVGAGLIFTHYADDYNIDHTTTYSLVRHCAMHSCLPIIESDAPPLTEHPAIFCCEPHGPVPFAPSHFVDITEFEEEKVRLMQHHRSQEEVMTAALGTGFDKLCGRPDSYWGEQAICDYAEAFVPMPARGAVKPFSVLP